METAKVDVQRLQLLNDRICQTIDALNQVRLSVHGLSHATGVAPSYNYPVIPGMGYGYGYGAPVPQTPGYFQGYLPGISHTTPVTPQAWIPGQGFAQTPQHGFAQTPAWPGQVPWLGGLGHTTPVQDPLWAARCAQAFPYAFCNIPMAIY